MADSDGPIVDNDQPTALIEALQGAEVIAVLTGAGVSAESGIPTFREALTGLWAQFRAEELATPEAFERDPEKVTRWYDHRRLMCLGCAPNAGHRALAALQGAVEGRGGRFVLVTQNVDRLHQRAGSTGVMELHGSILIWRCTACGREAEERGGLFDHYPPLCGTCAGPRRPGVVWFGEMLPPQSLAAAEDAAGSCDLFLSVGTSSQVYPAAGLVEIAMRSGAKVAEVNIEPTPLSDRVDWAIRQPSAQVLPKLVARTTE